MNILSLDVNISPACLGSRGTTLYGSSNMGLEKEKKVEKEKEEEKDYKEKQRKKRSEESLTIYYAKHLKL